MESIEAASKRRVQGIMRSTVHRLRAAIDIMRSGKPLLQGRNIPRNQVRIRLYFAAYGHNQEWRRSYGISRQAWTSLRHFCLYTSGQKSRPFSGSPRGMRLPIAGAAFKGPRALSRSRAWRIRSPRNAASAGGKFMLATPPKF
jgi:hypothetical protein